MPSNLTDFGERKALDFLCQAGSLYVALFTVAPDDAGAGGTEVSAAGGSNYARLAPTMAAASTDVNGVTTKGNSADAVWAPAGTVWGTIVAIGAYETLAGGSMVWHRNLSATEQRAINVGDQFRLLVGKIVFGAD